MKFSKSVKPVSYLKAHAAEILRLVSENKTTMVITQNGEAKAVVQDVASYEQTMESLAMLKLLNQSRENLKAGRVKSAADAFKSLQSKIKKES